MPDRGICHGTQKANEVIVAIAPLDLAVLEVVLALDETEDRSFDCVGNVWSHECVAIAPTTQRAYRSEVVVKPVTVQCVSGSGLGPDVIYMHDSGIKKRLGYGESPLEAGVSV